MNKRRKAAAASAPPPVPAADSDDTDAPASSSEHLAEGAEAPEETVDSADLAAAPGAETTETTEGTQESQENQETEAEETAAEKPPKSVRDLQKRVGKVTEQRNEAREEAEYWKKKAADLESRAGQRQEAESAPAHPGDEAFAAHREIQEFDHTLGKVEKYLAWADDHPDGGSYDDDGKSYELTAEDVRAYSRKSRSEMVRVSAKREAKIEALRADFDTKRKAAHAEAARLYPWIEQKGTPEFQEAVALIRENPGVLQRPDFELMVARQVVGQRLEREALKNTRTAAPARPKGSPIPVPVVTRPASAVPRSAASPAAAVKSAEAQFHTTGRLSDLTKMLAQRRAARLAEAAQTQ